MLHLQGEYKGILENYTEKCLRIKILSQEYSPNLTCEWPRYADLQSFKNALTGKSAAIMETTNGTKTLVHYSPANALQAKW